MIETSAVIKCRIVPNQGLTSQKLKKETSTFSYLKPLNHQRSQKKQQQKQ